MKIYAYYDLEGNIQSLISVEAAEGAFAMRAPQPGQFVDAEIVGSRGYDLVARPAALD